MGGWIRIGFDATIRRGDGVLLAYVFDPQGGCVNSWMIRSGLARYDSTGTTAFARAFRLGESEARDSLSGLWFGYARRIHFRSISHVGGVAYVDIVNSSDREEILLGWSLADQDGWQFPLPNVSLAPSEMIRVYAGDGRQRPAGSYSAPIGPAVTIGRRVELRDPRGRLADAIQVPVVR